MDEETQILLGIAETLKGEYVGNDDESEWKDSPFLWVKDISAPRRKGALGERLVAGWCAAKGMNVCRSPDSEADRVIENQRVEIKFSLKWENGSYTFQQIRDQNYDHLVCLGISPFMAHCWVISKQAVLQEWGDPGGYITSQHTGGSGTDTAWFTVNPQAPPPNLNVCGGSLAAAFSIIQGW